jgi:hypothetical protein
MPTQGTRLRMKADDRLRFALTRVELPYAAICPGTGRRWLT